MSEIEKIVPHYSLLRQDMKDKTGQTLSYFKGVIEGCSIGHYIPSYHFDNYHEYDCLSVNKSEHPCPSEDFADHVSPISLFMWYKQMDDKVNFRHTLPE